MRTFIALVALVALSACGNDSTGPIPAALAGTWSLKSYNGSALPYTIVQIGVDKAELSAGSLNLQASGVYTAVLTLRTTQNGVVATQPQSEVGSFTVNGNTVVLRPTDPSKRGGSALLSSNTLTYSGDGNVLVFTKN